MLSQDGVTPTIPVVLNGPGRVGKEFVRLLSQEADAIAARVGRKPVLRAVQSRRGILLSRGEVTLDHIDSWLDSETPALSRGLDDAELSSFQKSDYPLVLDLVRTESPGVVVEATPTDIDTGEPGLTNVVTALEKGFSVVLLSKGPLVVEFSRLRDLAAEHRVFLAYSGAVAAALPTVDTAIYSMAGSGIYEIEGVLNGTTNYILNSMSSGKTYSAALSEAQSMGVAEANPRLDVEGFDSAAKILIIANSVWGLGLTLDSVQRTGIVGIRAAHVRDCAKKGTPIRLVARAILRGADLGIMQPEITVAPEPVAVGHPFAALSGTAKAVRFRSKHMGEVVVLGGASDITGAAASALKDLIHILEGTKTR